MPSGPVVPSECRRAAGGLSRVDLVRKDPRKGLAAAFCVGQRQTYRAVCRKDGFAVFEKVCVGRPALRSISYSGVGQSAVCAPVRR